MPLVVIAALSVILAMHVVIFWRLAVTPRRPRPVRIAIGIALGVLLALFLGALRSLWAPLLSPGAARPLAWIGMTWLAFAVYLVLALALVTIVAGVQLFRGRDESAPRRLAINRIGSLVAVALATIVTGWGVVEAGAPRVVDYRISSADLPAELNGTKIAVLSDLHTGAVWSEKLVSEVVTITNQAKPDIVILAGDLSEGAAGRYGSQLEPLKNLTAPLGVYAVTGNHEFISGEPQAWIDTWKGLGVTPLLNQSVTAGPAGAHLRIAGVHDASGRGELASDPAAALAGSTPDEFIVYLAHQPKQALEVQGRGIDLQISGHTHGGQLWPVHGLVLLDQPMLSGFATVGDVPVVTSRGAGTWGPPVRVGAPPQIPVITLTRDR